jgi:hypothetical protein
MAAMEGRLLRLRVPAVGGAGPPDQSWTGLGVLPAATWRSRCVKVRPLLQRWACPGGYPVSAGRGAIATASISTSWSG